MAVVVVGVVGACAVAERAVAGWALEGLLEAHRVVAHAFGLCLRRGDGERGGVRRIYGAPLPDRCTWAHRQQGWQGMPGEGRLGGFGRGAGLLREEGGQD